ncbi:MAG: M48 family metallopeptidase [Sulfuricaulis sp.]|nr:M48 family metallopeptidase [Sulfuricaulis sp.]
MKTLKITLLTALLSLMVVSPVMAINLDKLREIKEKLKPLQPTSEQDEITLGKDVAANLLGAAPLVNDPALQTYVNKIGVWIALHTDRPGLPWRFGVLDTGSVNAFATPGGYVFLTRGMLLRMRDEAELAGVLAHEISHVVEKHALTTMRKGALAGMASDALSRNQPGYAKLVSAGTEIFARGLDKEDEYAADRMGVVLATRAGYDPYGLPAVLQTLSSINPKDDAVSLMFKTHPDSEKRLELVSNSMEGRFDEYVNQPKVEARFSSIIKSHIAIYKPVK